MKVTQHGDNLIKLTRMFVMNCYLVREDDGFTLVDTGMSGSAKAIVKAAESFGKPIRRITLTHAHVDHIGSLDALHALLPDAEVSITAREARFMSGDLSLDPREQHDKLAGGFPVCTTKPNRMLTPGDHVGSLEVIATPGHTPGHISFFDPRNRTIIAGDAYQTQGGVATPGMIRLLFPLPAMATWSKADGLRSAEALLKLQPSQLAVGHGKVLVNPQADMKKAIDEARHKIQG
jgi:glyoxylase-like metal-dependent hydrolase (beta-lactamase superfamily II)